MLTCKEATRLLSQSQDRPLALGERIMLHIHLKICQACANYRGQMDFLRQACRGYASHLQSARESDTEKPRSKG